jgi:hypothetical protein
MSSACPPQVVVVHRRQVVVHERVRVNELDRRGHGIERRLGHADELATRVDEQRPHAFAAAENGVAHRGEQRLGHLRGGVENVGELLIDSAAVMIETLREWRRGSPCYHRGPS